ncbi:flagellar basal body rod protein FlgB [Chitinasiproducens palmae]|uniref:Flagellar basal body rod protein FlgB n=1 Tax=Chitinasiproducens palmae TaxID=1770053 RepID=A0A1H2PLQ7_9BURK|nr:flagellar basal body rod protein FlgB [Chitinasiproducens palmae]SDV46610.1 flagellar basal-body rod protein FlgB [Chitinasiproducens palmae]
MDKLDAELRFGREALNLRAYRQELLSSNIANVDTPGYKSRDVDFAASLGRALGGAQDEGAGVAGGSAGRLPLAASQNGAVQPAVLAMSATSGAHLAGLATAASARYGTPQYRTPAQSSLDGNTVELDAERVNFADNALHYQTGMTVVSQQIKTMLAALGNG